MPYSALASDCTVLNSNLRTGMSSKDVTALQNFLYKNSFLDVRATGFFGIKTTLAVKNYQKRAGIEQTGFVGPLTRASIGMTSCITPGVVACTMEARLCPDGSVMQRSTTTCEWFPNSCPVKVVQATTTYKYEPKTASSSMSLLDALKQALVSVGATSINFGTTTMTEKEILEMTKKFEQDYIFNR